MLTGSDQKVRQSVAPPESWSTRTKQTPGVEVGAKSFLLLERNTVNPTSGLAEAGRTVRGAEGMAGRGCWKKPKPSCNRMDRGQWLPHRGSGLTSSRPWRTRAPIEPSWEGIANELGFAVCAPSACFPGMKAIRSYRPDRASFLFVRFGSIRVELVPRLEPDEAKVSCPVPRGGGGGNVISLPDRPVLRGGGGSNAVSLPDIFQVRFW